MAIDRRRCFWFGTEERAGFFPTPLQGADSSPSAWGVDGTLLNGGGYAFNSWGSHKRYTYEWPQSSSPETAQMMKSYRDGSFGRGLLYFLEPGIYRTNILPAHWADPSMSLDNEAPSLVYGIDPVAVPTSGGDALGLPIISAQYDLSSTAAQSVPTPDSSVFLPVPTAHTLILGAFYSATGTGGVFATPVNSNGTLGTAVKLTQKSNSDTSVVIDQFSGDIRGVRLWVGRTDSTASSVTIAAMTGRLIETSNSVTYGPWIEQRRNLLVNPRLDSSQSGWVTQSGSGWTTTTLNGRQAGLVTMGSALNALASDFTTAVSGSFYSARVVLAASSASSVGRQVRLGIFDGTTFLSEAVVTLGAIGVEVPVTVSTSAATSNGVRLYIRRGAGAGTVLEGDVFYVTDGIEERSTSLLAAPGTWFWGSSESTDVLRYRWAGATVTSASIQEVRTRTGDPTKTEKLSRGPWIGGQGHSGCRFLGTPSYVTNSPIEGGRIGFAASFVEAGSWVYG